MSGKSCHKSFIMNRKFRFRMMAQDDEIRLTHNAILPARRIAVLATPAAQALELAGPIEVFAMAERKLKEAGRSRSPAYLIDILSATEDLTIRSSSGLSMLAQRCYSEVTEPIDTLLVAGGMDLWS